MHLTHLRRAIVAPVTFAILAAAAHAQLTVNVDANVAGQGDTQVGMIAITFNTPTANPNVGTGGIRGDFTFGDGFGYLDGWYNFRWINVATGYTLNGVPQTSIPGFGTLPLIDPLPGNDPMDNTSPFNDPAPFYFTNLQHANGTAAGVVIHVPGVSSLFLDSRFLSANNAVVHFTTYLVAENVSGPAGGFGAMSMNLCVLAGYRWNYDNTAGQNQVYVGGIPMPVAADKDLIDTALGNATAAPTFAGWSAFLGCQLNACPLGNVKSSVFTVDDHLLNTGELATFMISGEYEVTEAEISLGTATIEATLWEHDILSPNDLVETKVIKILVPPGTMPGDCLSFSTTFAAFDPMPYDSTSDPCFGVELVDGDEANSTTEIETDSEDSYPMNQPNPTTVSDILAAGFCPGSGIGCAGGSQFFDLPQGGSVLVEVMISNCSNLPQEIAINTVMQPVDNGAQQGYSISPQNPNLGMLAAGATTTMVFTVDRTGPTHGAILLDAYFVADPMTRDPHLLVLNPLPGDGADPNCQIYCDPAGTNSTGMPVSLACSLSATAGSAYHLDAHGGPAGQFGFFLVAAQTGFFPIGDGALCLSGPIGRYSAAFGGSGNSIGLFDSGGSFTALVNSGPTGMGFDLPASLPNPPGGMITAGQTWNFQLWYRDQNPTPTVNFSNGVSLTF